MKVIVQCCASQAADDPEHVAHIHAPALPDCYAQWEHHTPISHINLHSGEWTYVIMAERAASEDHYLDATQSVTEAFRTARKHLGRVLPGHVKVRKGLAYGFIVSDEAGWTCTIVPTPRYKMSDKFRG